MANKNPKTDHLKATQFALVGDKPLSKEIITVRFTQEVTEKLKQLSGKERQALIRRAVERELETQGF